MNNRWLDSLGEMDEYVTSKQQIRKVKRIAGKLRGNKYHHLTRRALATLVAAAILLSTATIAIASESSRKFIIEKFKEYSIYKVENNESINVTPIEVGYLPEGFKKTYSFNVDNSRISDYTFNDKFISIIKWSNDFSVYYDTEEYNNESMNINGINYIVYKSNNNNYGIIWNTNNYNYRVIGNITKDELIKVALSTK